MTAIAEQPRTAEQALGSIGFDGERLLKLAQRVASDVIAGRVKGISAIPHIGDKREDLVSAMVERSCRAAIAYDPTIPKSGYGRNGGDPVQSYLSDIMENAARDYFRKKSEGFGDKRYGNHDRLVLSPMDEDPDPDVDFEGLVSEKRLARWQMAAEATGWTFRDWVCITLDSAAKQIERAAA